MKVVFVIVPFVKSRASNKTRRTVVTGLPLLRFPKVLERSKVLKSAIRSITNKHLGLGYMATGLKRANHSVKLIDGQALGISSEEVLEILQQESPDLVAMPIFTGGRVMVYDLVEKIRIAMPDLPVVLGGPHVTLYPELIFKECAPLCMALRGEADFTMAELATRLESGMPLDTIPGIVLRKDDGQVFLGPSPELIQDLDTIPFPDRDIYDKRLYNPIPMMLSLPEMEAEQVIASRGCDWHSCRFCYQSIPIMPCYRRRSPENVIEEMRMLNENYGTEFIVFTDDSFLRDENWIERFCNIYDRERLNLKWSVIGRVDGVTRSMLFRIAKSGCVHVAFGLETGNQETLDMLNKGTTLEQARKAVKWAHEAGLIVRGYIMLGLPKETPEMSEITLRFVMDLGVDYITIAPYHLLEGTPLEELALREGRLIPHDNIAINLPSYLPNTYTDAEQLIKMITRAYRRFYFRPGFIIRALWSVKNPRIWPAVLVKVWIGLHVVFQNKN